VDAVNKRRIWGYPLSVAALAGLVYGGFFYSPDPDLATLQSSVDVQLKLAWSIPAVDRDGKPLTERQEMLDEARATLDTIERVQPGLPSTLEYRAFLARIEGRTDDAVAHYRELRDHPDCDERLWSSAFFNEARALDDGGRTEDALAIMREASPRFTAEMQEEAGLYTAALLHKLGRTADAVAQADALAQGATIGPMTAVRAGRMLEDMGDPQLAEAAYAAAGERHGTALYYRSRLKMREGETDTALGLLERAVAESPAQVRRILDEDQDTWQGVAGTARFEEIRSDPEAVPAGPVR